MMEAETAEVEMGAVETEAAAEGAEAASGSPVTLS